MKFFHNKVTSLTALIAEGKINIVVLDGDELGKIKMLAKQMEEFCTAKYQDIEVCRFNMEEVGDPRLIESELLTGSMFSQKKLLLCTGLKPSDFDAIYGFNNSAELNNIGIFCFSEGLKAKGKKLEDSPNIAIITCYPDTEQDLQSVAATFVKQKGYSIDDDALNFALANCKGNRANLMMELEKLTIYCIETKSIDLRSAMAIITDGVEQNVFAQSDALLCMQAEQIVKTFARLEAAAEPFASVLPFVKRDALFLQNLLSKANANQVSAEEELKRESQKNKFLFVKMPALKQQLNYWTLKKINVFLKELQDTEVYTRQYSKAANELVLNLFLKFCLYK